MHHPISQASWPDLHSKAAALTAVCLSVCLCQDTQPGGTPAHECRTWHGAPAVPLSVCQAGTHGHGTAGARDGKHSLAAPKSPLCPRCYPQYPVPICQQMALLICLDCPQRRCALQGTVNKGGTLGVIPSVMGRLSPFTHLSHKEGL